MKRRKAREYALQILFQIDIRKEKPSVTLLKRFWADQAPDTEVKAFAEELAKGAHKHLKKIDELIRTSAEHWSIGRMSTVDRSMLRIAVYELLYRMDIPASVTINEAVEVVRRFGSDESSAFVNGILDNVARSVGKADREDQEEKKEEQKGPAVR